MSMVAIWITITGIGWGWYLNVYPPTSNTDKQRYGVAFILCILIFIGYLLILTIYNINVNQRIAMFINKGDALRRECITKEERKELIPRVDNWNSRMLDYLASINQSYASRVNTVTEFPNGIGSVVITPNLPNINRKVWHFINLRIQILNEILKERS